MASGGHFVGQGLAGFVQEPYKSADLIGMVIAL
jgi:hypothetical protein